MRKSVLILSFLILTGFAIAADAEISQGSPDDIVLDSSNSYEVTKEFDGEPSSPDSATHQWNWVENKTSKIGEKVEFTFTRQNPQTNSIELTILENNGNNDTTSVTQTLKDDPEITSTSPSSDKTLDLNESNEDGKVSYSVSASNTFDGPLSYEWTDGSGSVVSNQASFTYDFDSTGDYTFTVNVSDSQDFFSTKQVKTVTIENSSNPSNNDDTTDNTDSTSSSTSDEKAADFDQIYGLGDIQDGDVVEESLFSGEITDLSIGVSSDEEDTQLEAKTASNRGNLPNDPGEDPGGTVYEYTEFNTVNFSDNDIENVSFEFELDKNWVEDNDIVEDTVDLERYHDDQWNSLGAEKVDEDNDKLFFEADSPGLSVFAITGEEEKTDFEITDITLDPKDPVANSSFSIEVGVRNNGNIAGDYTVELDVGDETKEKDVTDLGADDSATAEFTHEFSDNGTYSIEAGDESVQVDLGASGSGLTTSSENNEDNNQDESEGKNNGLPWVILLIVILVIGVAVSAGILLYSDDEKREELIQKVQNLDLNQIKEGMFGGDEEEEDDFDWDGFEN